MSMSEPVQELDARGLNCPLPLLKLKQSLNRMSPGQQIRVWTTVPGSLRDFAAFTAMAGHTVLTRTEEDGAYYFLIEKGAS